MLKLKDGAAGGPANPGAGAAGLTPRGEGPGAIARDDGPGATPRGDGDVFQFTLVSGAVTDATMQTPGGSTVELRTPTGLTYTVDGEDVVATLVGERGTSTVVYSDTDDDGFYQVVASSHVMTSAPADGAGRPTRAVTVTLDSAASDVVEVSRLTRNGEEVVIYTADDAPEQVDWSVQQGLVVQTVTGPGGATHWGVFRDGNNDGVYTEVASGTGTMVDLVGVISATDAFANAL